MFYALTKNRRSIRVYADRAVETEKIQMIVEAALRSPSGRAARPWSFVVVTDRTLLEQLSLARPQGASFIKKAPLAVVVCGEPAASPIWLEDCAVAAVTIQYSAQDLGLVSCWSTMKDKWYNEVKTSTQYIAELLWLPQNLTVLCLIAIGYPDENIAPYKNEELLFERVSYNCYGRHLI